MTAEHEIVCGLLVRDRRVLLCHRRPDRAFYPDVWDLPGGHIEPGEAPERALIRELNEELGIVIAYPTAARLARFVDSGQDLSIWLIDEWTGAIENTAPEEHDELRWFSANDLLTVAIADDAYLPVISQAMNATGRSR